MAKPDEQEKPRELTRNELELNKLKFFNPVDVLERPQFCPGCGARTCWCGESRLLYRSEQ